MAKNRYFYCSEDDKVYDYAEIRREFDWMMELPENKYEREVYGHENGFAEWLNNCTDKNGALTEITENHLKDYPHKSKYGMPVVAIDWYTESPYISWGVGNAMERALVVRDYSDYIYDLFGNAIAEAVYVIVPHD